MKRGTSNNTQDSANRSDKTDLSLTHKPTYYNLIELTTFYIENRT